MSVMAGKPAVRPPVKFTYKEYRTLPEGSRYQLIEGDLIVSPAPSWRHQIVLMRIAVALYNFVTPKGLGFVCAAPVDVILGDQDTAQPDVLYVAAEHASMISPEGVRGGPDLCVEILSKRTEALDRGAKRLLYAKHGVAEYWIVDPEANTLEVFRLQDNPNTPKQRLSMKDKLTTDLLPGFSLDLNAVLES